MRKARRSAETAVKRELARKIALERRLLRESEILLQVVADAIQNGGTEEFRPAIASLLSRSASDVRSIQLLLERGYSLQALTLAASAYEHLVMAAYIGGSIERAESWSKHEDPFHNRTVNAIVPDVQRRTGLSTIAVSGQRKYRDALYALLCCAKHGNPLLQSRLDIVSSPDSYYLSAVPSISRGVLVQAEMAAFAAMRGIVFSLAVLNHEGVLQESTIEEFGTFLGLANKMQAKWDASSARRAAP